MVDKTDGVTLKTDATTITDIDHATNGIFLSKNGGTAAVRHQAVTASVADAYGMMKVTLDTTDTNTLGSLDVLFAKAATYLPVHRSFVVVPSATYGLIDGTSAIADSYATDGSQPTMVQALLAVHQFLMERAVVGTTMTVYKPNGSTAAMTFTLDSATAPTSITRAS